MRRKEKVVRRLLKQQARIRLQASRKLQAQIEKDRAAGASQMGIFLTLCVSLSLSLCLSVCVSLFKLE